ncbi:hypothetical protein ACC741_36970, partial [Rhizobium johnstonii]
FIKISSIIKPEKILLLKPVNYRGDYPLNGPELTSKWIISTGQGQCERGEQPGNAVVCNGEILAAYFDRWMRPSAESDLVSTQRIAGGNWACDLGRFHDDSRHSGADGRRCACRGKRSRWCAPLL